MKIASFAMLEFFILFYVLELTVMFIFIQINLIKRFSQTYYETEIQQFGDGMFNI